MLEAALIFPRIIVSFFAKQKLAERITIKAIMFVFILVEAFVGHI
jgi:hypothetical protein